ncbi:thymidylate kinase [Bacteroidia bacterium]|nr:thymidylate kinase [Bacteroidia bacterium]
MTNFIAIEGLDGAGKSTQIRMIEQYLQQQGKRTQCLHFPRVDVGIWGDLVARFLRGDLGKINDVHPYLVALVYAEDRRAAAPLIQQWINENYFVIIDRYVYSNIAYQCAKTSNDAECSALRDWILHLEYEEFGIPKPQKCLFLDVPSTFTKATLQQQRTGDERAYLQGKQDIHEASLDFQQQVRKVYLQQASLDPQFHVISCIEEHTNAMASCEKTFEKIKLLLN